MKLRAELSFVYSDAKEAEAVAEAVTPDNFKVPEGLDVSSVAKNNELLSAVHCDKSLMTFLATLDDLLACISVAEKVVQILETRQ
ncbi:MAG: KEOPS complex subunit Pcc1 [Candidatus Bathyarchaeota archaeon]|nr:KEOPS complex subunit Pcc1 [Candidatus Bathyarchaeota archaeon]